MHVILRGIMEVLTSIDRAFKAPDDVKKHFLDFVKSHPENFNSRENEVGHITCSMLVMNEARDKVLLTHHKKFNMWLQLGGHWDDLSQNALQTALIETSEEGFGEMPIVCDVFLNAEPFDLDIHEADGPTGVHKHFDICFACVVKEDFKVSISHESLDLQWFEIEKIIGSEMLNARLNRLLKKSQKINGETIPFEVTI